MPEKTTILKYAAGACLLVAFATAIGGFFGSAELDVVFNSDKLCPTLGRPVSKSLSTAQPHCMFLRVGVFLELVTIAGLIYSTIVWVLVVKRDFKGDSCTVSTQRALFLVGGIWLIIGGVLMFASATLPVINYLTKGGVALRGTDSPLSENKIAFKQAEKMTSAFAGIITGALFIILWKQLKGPVSVEPEEEGKSSPPDPKPSLVPDPKPSLQTVSSKP